MSAPALTHGGKSSDGSWRFGRIWKNKTGTSKVGAISKAQKVQNIFLEKKLEIFGNFFFRKKSRTVPKKIKRGEPLASAGFVGYIKK